MNEVLAAWNGMGEAEAVQSILPCNGSRAWARGVARRRPMDGEEALCAAADEVWRGLGAEAWQEAFASHPRIGEREAEAATEASLRWSASEQSAAGGDREVKAALREANRVYEARFGRIFLVCATGKGAAEMLAILRARLPNDAETELREAAEQQRQITQLRLRKWLGRPAARCEDV